MSATSWWWTSDYTAHVGWGPRKWPVGLAVRKQRSLGTRKCGSGRLEEKATRPGGRGEWAAGSDPARLRSLGVSSVQKQGVPWEARGGEAPEGPTEPSNCAFPKQNLRSPPNPAPV